MSIVCAHPTNLNGAIKVGLKFDAQARENPRHLAAGVRARSGSP
jgi:hypothetical protein